MNLPLFITPFIFFVFPMKIFSHVNIIMEFSNLSLSGNNGTIAAFCRRIQSFNGIKADPRLCLMQNENISHTKEIICQSTFVNVNDSTCDQNLLGQLNVNISLWRPVASFLKNTSLFLTFQIHPSEPILRSTGINVDRQLSVRHDDMVRIVLASDAFLEVSLAYKLKCAKNYYGPDCELFCEAMDNKSGHYYCSKYGKLTCLSGWQGLFCTEAVCRACVNGQCIAPGKCKCYKGWTGLTCSSCQKSSRCKHGTCDSTVGVPFTCTCEPGWGGQFCDIDLKHCLTHPSLCQNNGTCHNYYGDSQIHYMCKCMPGFSGRHCQLKTGDCIYKKCKSRNCMKEQLATQCICYSGYSGLHCQINDFIENEFQSLHKDAKSDGFCFNHDEGYSCSCSRSKIKICHCKFIKCPTNSSCKDKSRPAIYCSGIPHKTSVWQFSSNFAFENYSISSYVIQTPETYQKFTKDQSFKFYVASFVFVPILLGALVLAVIKFTFKFRKKPRTCVKTIFNDLGLPNNVAIKPSNFKENRFLLHQTAMSTSVQNDKCLNNTFLVQESDSKGVKCQELVGSVEELKEIEKSPISDTTKKSTIVCNPNLLINHYKDLHENVK